MKATTRYPLWRNVLTHWLPMILWMGWIFWLSSQPKLPHPARKVGISDTFFDYCAHAFTFGVLCVLAWRVSAHLPWIPSAAQSHWPVASAAAFAALYAITDEGHQAFVPGRRSTAADWLSDVAGIVLAACLLTLWRRWQPWLRRWAATHAPWRSRSIL